MTDIKNVRMAVLIEQSSLGTREGRLRRSTVPSSTGRTIARSAITGQGVTAGRKTSGTETRNSRKG